MKIYKYTPYLTIIKASAHSDRHIYQNTMDIGSKKKQDQVRNRQLPNGIGVDLVRRE